MKIENKTILITGTNRGIGRARIGSQGTSGLKKRPGARPPALGFGLWE